MVLVECGIRLRNAISSSCERDMAMKMSIVESPPAGHQSMGGFHAITLDSTWKPLYKIGAVAALIMVAFIPVQMIIFLGWPPPDTVSGYFMLFQHNWLLGLLSLDLLYIVDNVLVILLYLALYAALRQASKTFMAVALTLSLVGIAAYFASNTAFEMLSLSNQFAAATTDAQRSLSLAAGQAMLATYKGTAFDVYYVLNAVATLVISVVMLRSNIFGKVTAYVGIVTGVLMVVPSTSGTIGLYLAIVSLVPTAIWLFLIARRLLRPGQVVSKEDERKKEHVHV